MYLSTDFPKQLLTICLWYISKWNSRASLIMMLVKHGCFLPTLLLISLFLLVSTAFIVANIIAECLFDIFVGWINPGTFCAAFTYHCSGLPGSSITLFCPLSDSMSAVQFSLLSIGLSQLPFQWNQSLVSQMVSGTQSSSLSTGWRWILLIWLTVNIWVLPSRRSFTDQGGGKGNFLTIQMQPHYHVERVTRMLQRCVPRPKCIQLQWSACFEHEILFVQRIGFGCPATWPKRHGPWPFGAIFFPPPLSSFQSHFLCSWYSILCDRHPKLCYWLDQTALQRHFRAGSRLWDLTASSR